MCVGGVITIILLSIEIIIILKANIKKNNKKEARYANLKKKKKINLKCQLNLKLYKDYFLY